MTMMNLIACGLCGSPSNHVAEVMLVAAVALVATAVVRLACRRQVA